METKTVIHWLSFAAYIYIFGYAALFKIIQLPEMMSGMESMGFGKNWTLVIGWAELFGVLGLLVGVFVPPVKNSAVLFLLPFAIGAFTVHMSYHHAFDSYRNSLIVCILPFILLYTDKKFKLVVK